MIKTKQKINKKSTKNKNKTQQNKTQIIYFSYISRIIPILLIAISML